MPLAMGVRFYFNLQGVHNWPDAEDEGLRKTHRHRFKFDVEIETYRDREFDFLKFRGSIQKYFFEKYYKGFFYDFGDRSCEKLARETLFEVAKKLSVIHERRLKCTVWESDNDAAGVSEGVVLQYLKNSDVS